MYVTTVTQKGQVTISIQLRRQLGLKQKDKVAFDLIDGEVRLRPVRSQVIAGYGAVEPTRRPEDYRTVRREVEEEMAARLANDA